MDGQVDTSFAWRLEGHLNPRIADGTRVDPAIAEALGDEIGGVRIEVQRLRATREGSPQRWAVRVLPVKALPKIAKSNLDEIADRLTELEMVLKERVYENPENLLRSKTRSRSRTIRVFLGAPTLTSALD